MKWSKWIVFTLVVTLSGLTLLEVIRVAKRHHTMGEILNSQTLTGWEIKDVGHTAPMQYADMPKFKELVLAINNHRYGPNNGLFGGLPLNGRASCGHPGAVSEITWKFLQATDTGDLYEFTRRFPKDGEIPQTTTKQLVYGGKALVIFEDQVQRVVIGSREAVAVALRAAYDSRRDIDSN